MYALCKLCRVNGDFSEIARQGSGSACRSVYGGFVQWHMGVKEDGSDSVASVVKEADHWKAMRVLILVVSKFIQSFKVNLLQSAFSTKVQNFNLTAFNCLK